MCSKQATCSTVLRLRVRFRSHRCSPYRPLYSRPVNRLCAALPRRQAAMPPRCYRSVQAHQSQRLPGRRRRRCRQTLARPQAGYHVPALQRARSGALLQRQARLHTRSSHESARKDRVILSCNLIVRPGSSCMREEPHRDACDVYSRCDQMRPSCAHQTAPARRPNPRRSRAAGLARSAARALRACCVAAPAWPPLLASAPPPPCTTSSRIGSRGR